MKHILPEKPLLLNAEQKAIHFTYMPIDNKKLFVQHKFMGYVRAYKTQMRRFLLASEDDRTGGLLIYCGTSHICSIIIDERDITSMFQIALENIS